MKPHSVTVVVEGILRLIDATYIPFLRGKAVHIPTFAYELMIIRR